MSFRANRELPFAYVVGEALIDLIPHVNGNSVSMVGGGPANTAKAVAQLGRCVYFVGGISNDHHGKVILQELSMSGVDLSLVYRGNQGTAVAIATIDENGRAKYDFELQGTASFAFDASWLPTGEPDVLHVGSVATLLEPGASELLKWVSSKSAPVIFDPNVRPSIQGDKALYRVAVERWIEKASIIKLSVDDLNWLYDGGEEEIVYGWLARGVSIVVVTRAEEGLRAYSSNSVIEVPAVKVELVDSVGAGDTIGAVIVEGVLKYGVKDLRGDVLKSVLERATRAAAITCSRAGANPPTLEELEAF